MNAYKEAMEQIRPPEGLEARLLTSLETAPAPRGRVLRPRSFGKKVLLLAAAAVLLTLSVGAAVLAGWDRVLVERFGPEAMDTAAGEAAFQEVNAASVCGDVTLTVRQALSDSKTVWLLLDCRLPASAVERAGSPDRAGRARVDVVYAAGSHSWEAFRDAEADLWQQLDWDSRETRSSYCRQSGFLQENRLRGDASGEVSAQGWDPETRTLTFLCRYTIEGAGALSDQSLTLVVLPPVLSGEDGTLTALTDHPALVSFRLGENDCTAEGAWREAGVLQARVRVSAFAVTVETWTGEESIEALYRDTALVFRDGRTVPVSQLTRSMSGSSGSGSASFSAPFREILDTKTVQAVRVGGRDIPVELP